MNSRQRLFEMLPSPRIFAFLLAFGLGASGAAAQNIADILVSIQDTKTKEIREEIHEGDTIHLEVGDRVRLRFVAESRNGRSRHYPSGTYELHNASGLVSMTVNAERGSAVLTAHKARNRHKPDAVPFIRYEITRQMNMASKLFRGTLYVKVKDPKQEVVTPEPAPEPDREEVRGITLFEHQDFRGRSQRFTEDDRQLNNDFLRHDMASSVRVDAGCEVVLYEHPDFQGKATVLTESETDLRRTRVGSDTVSSLEIDCDRGYQDRPNRRDDGGRYDRDRGYRPGVTLFEHQDFRGRSETFYEDDEELRNNTIGADRASSLRLDPGCRAVIYEHPDYGGRASVFTEDVTDLNGTRVGNDTASAIEVRCDDRRRRN